MLHKSIPLLDWAFPDSQFLIFCANPNTDIFLGISTDKMEAAGAVIVAIMSKGLNNGRGWPFVTVPDFQERAEAMKDATGVLYVGFNPIISQANRAAWENYTNNAVEAQWYERARGGDFGFGYAIPGPHR